MNQTILERVRCMLLGSSLPKLLWGEAAKTTNYLINRSPASAIQFKSPEEVWTGKPVDLRNLKIFGCAAFVHQSEGKFEPRAPKYVFLGCGERVKGYRLWVKEIKVYKIILSRNVVFNEFNMPCLKFENNATKSGHTENERRETEIEVQNTDETDLNEPDFEVNQPLNDYQLARDREMRQIKPHVRFDDEMSFLTVQGFIENELESYKDAMSSKDSKH
ncbi:retrovirus-related Pol poly from transposon TNT 1-94 [Olea europaea subsp. europaea]|uniref:Retrovirus-related Pol poly from transposon TNT 1-94 n=1 Tax=Olea europaea subsp. europaea TaxID=158383 RepID=A0A8S0SW56_OLEEU|nr:retrovirus-related Pol poly from transposon TNT 1-94 [Olea europaea subsp. europaea]